MNSNTCTNKYNFKYSNIFSLLCIYRQLQVCYTLFVDFIYYARRRRASHELRRNELKKKANLKELSNNISDRSEAKGTGILSDLLLGERSEVSGKSAVYYIINGLHNITQTDYEKRNW